MSHKFFLTIAMGIFLIINASNALAESVQWRSFSSHAFAAAKNQNKLVLMYVGSESCHWCAKMYPESFQSPDIINIIHKRFIPVSIDIVSERSIANSYGAYGTPTFIILDSNKHEVSRVTGYQSPDEFKAYLESL